MSSSTYITQSSDLAPGTRAKAEDINTRHHNECDGFAKLPACHSSAPATKGFSEDVVMEVDGATENSVPRVSQVRDAVFVGTDSGAANAYVVTLSPAPSAYTTGMRITFKPVASNTGACTINVNSLGVKNIKSTDSGDPAANEIFAGNYVDLIYDGTNFQILTASMASLSAPSVTLPAPSVAYSGLRANGDADAYELGQGLDNSNRVINQEMMIDQRNEGTATTTTGSFTVDRLVKYFGNTDELVISAVRSTGIGSSRNSAKVTATTAETAVAADEYITPFNYRFLGYNVADLASETVTISFDFKSNMPDNTVFSVALRAGDSSRSYVTDFTYTTSAADQTVIKTVTLESGTITNTTTGVGLILVIGGCGGADNAASGTDAWEAGSKAYSGSQANWITTLNAYVQISSLQLRKGSAYVPIRHKTFEEYIYECSRYFVKSLLAGTKLYSNPEGAVTHVAMLAGVNLHSVYVPFGANMVGIPTITFQSLSGLAGGQWYNVTDAGLSGVAATSSVGKNGFTAINPGVATDGVGEYIKVHYEASAEI